MRRIFRFSLLSLLLVMVVAAIVAQKMRTNYVWALEEGSRIVPTQWNLKTGKNVLWRTPLGSTTWRSPVLSGDKIFIGTNNTLGLIERYPGDVDLGVLLCIRKSDGKYLWQDSNTKLPLRTHDWPMQGITSRPCVQGDRLWYVTNRAEVVCLDTNGFRDEENDGPEVAEVATTLMDSDVVWRYDMIANLDVRPHNVSTCTVAVWKDRVFVVTGNGVDASHNGTASDAPSFIALDKATGRLLWSDNSPGGNVLHGQWASPKVISVRGRDQVLFPGGDGWLYSFDPNGKADGKSKLLWKFDVNPKDAVWKLGGMGTRNHMVNAPTVYDGRLYFAVGHDPEHGPGEGRILCIHPNGRGDVSEQVVFNKSNPEKPIAHRRELACDPAKGDFTRPNPSSALVWNFEQKDLNANGKIDGCERISRTLSVPAVKDGLAIITDGDGYLHCFDAKTGKRYWHYDLLTHCYASPVIAGNHVYIGDEDGYVSVFGFSSDPSVALPGGSPVDTINCLNSIYGTMKVENNVMYIVTSKELIAVAKPK